jgi:transposase
MMTERERDERDLAILADRDGGMMIKQIAAKYGLGVSTVNRILKETR